MTLTPQQTQKGYAVSSLFDKQQEQLQYQTENEIKINFITNLPSVQNYNTIEVNPKVRYNLHPTAELSPKICLQSNGLDIPLQEDEIFAPYELKNSNTGTITTASIHYKQKQRYKF